MGETLIRRVLAHEAERPEKMAVAFKNETLSYAQLAQRLRAVACALDSEGIGKNDTVLFTAVSKPMMVPVYLGIQYLGARVVFMDKNGTPASYADIYRDSKAAVLITDKPMKEYASGMRILSEKALYEYQVPQGAVPPVYQEPRDEEIAEMLYTSGTTGKPKGVMLSYKAISHIMANTIEGIGIRDDDVVLIPLPLHHSFALRVLRSVLYCGASVVLQNGFTFARDVEKNIDQFHCTAMISVPASIETIRSQMQDRFAQILGKLRYLEVGAGSLSVRQRKELTKMLPDTVIYNTWGSSETGGAIFLNVSETAEDPVKVASLGKPRPEISLLVLDPEGKPMESDREHPGRMALKGDMKMSGYFGRPELNAQTFQGDYLLTSDMVYTDKDGYVYMLGRADDMINVGGEKVSPIEVENVASQFEQVRECACIGVDDPEGITGQAVLMFVVPRDGSYSQAALQKYLASRLERAKLPALYMVLERLPRNAMLKIDRRQLRTIWENRETYDLINPVMQAILTRRSIRKFRPDPIPEKILEMILKAGIHAPTGHNMQSWRFTVLTREKDIRKLKEAMKETAKANRVYCYGFDNPQAVVLISNDSRNPDGAQDCSCAAENMFLAAASYGLGAAWINALMTLRDKEPVKSLLDSLGVPEGHVVWCTAVFGYPVSDGMAVKRNEQVIHYV